MKRLFTVLALSIIGLPSLAAADSDYCREYTRSVRVGTHLQEGYGTACLQPDGSWQIVSSDVRPDATVVYRDPAPVIVTPGAPYYYQPRYIRPYYPPRSSIVLGFNFGSPHHYGYGHGYGHDDHGNHGHHRH